MARSRTDTHWRKFDASTIFFALLALRIANALTLRTFFQPDEYYQALEPAWQIAFGQESGAWITWVQFMLSRFLFTLFGSFLFLGNSVFHVVLDGIFLFLNCLN